MNIRKDFKEVNYLELIRFWSEMAGGKKKKRTYKIKVLYSLLFLLQGAQIFEAVGLHKEVMDMCFTGSSSRIGGVTFEILAKEVITSYNT